MAGVFVSIYRNDSLRGCVGTIAPTTDSIAQEIIKNAVSAGLYDNRFDEVSVSELSELVYSVDVLSPPEEIADAKELDVKKYGVIVSKGNKRGLLLPDLNGIDTVEEQIAIAKRKAGISDKDKVKLERFLVTRYSHD
jgi:AmmeMemoRadiSam system protein A